jgi:hypothetical protein
VWDLLVGWVIIRVLEVPRRLVGGLVLLACGLAVLGTSGGVTTGVRTRAAIRSLLAVLLVGGLLISPATGSGGMVSAGAVSATDQEGRWSVTSLPEPRNGMETVTVGDVALFVGGGSLGPPSSVVDIYDHATRQWTTATLFVGRTGPSTATVGTKVLIAGG